MLVEVGHWNRAHVTCGQIVSLTVDHAFRDVAERFTAARHAAWEWYRTLPYEETHPDGVQSESLLRQLWARLGAAEDAATQELATRGARVYDPMPKRC